MASPPLPSSSPIRPRDFTPTAVMTRCAQKHRPPMFEEASYSPPPWASHLHPLPSRFISLGQFPTPIHKWNLPNLPNGTEVWIKRDDLTGMQLSGNKVRKLEFLMAEAKAEGADCVITLGGIQSNHCRATAVAARYLNLDCFLILRTNRTQVDVDPGLVGNLLVERMVGAHVELVSKEEYRQHGSEMLGKMLKKKLLSEGRAPYLIPVGGSNSLGVWGYLEAVREIEEQLRESTCHPDGFDDIVMACGSGGTTAGLALGFHLSPLKARVHGYGVCDDPEYFYDFIQGLLDGMNANVAARDIVNIVDAKGLGYAMSTNAELAFVKEIAEATGIVLDPVYSGKALFGLLRDMKEKPGEWSGKKVLFVHTGGLLGMYDKLQQLQPFISKWKRFQIPESTSEAGMNVGRMF
ncbi:hypothetical protein KP509_01G039500 [Ceratopteris richardii]|uniref:D-cysteine desulfhydrase n=1 Tax=Ceratopteris richardii TaxID=49495 RepID=A0A8T2VFW4_CERRI|nr:hypothetical protein KP509_01G039500 [Ceratopteris richardii]KAH7446111.1 hypothetical protein KP509_01G039500 [Ceratopteris richardii]